jgi:hypothetical protein
VQQVLPKGYMNQGGVVVGSSNPAGTNGNYGWAEGEHGWYASDFGYTKITMSNGSDFSNVGFDVGSGFDRVTPTYIYYKLLKDGQAVSSGYVPFLSDPRNNGYPCDFGYLGFSGGGFNEIWVRDCNGPTHYDGSLGKNVLDVQPGDPFSASNLSGNYSALAIDAVEVSSVPEPSTLALLGIAVISLAVYRQRRRKPVRR